jgi:hypothetical protein
MADMKELYPDRYVTRFDFDAAAWQIVDMWHNDIKNLMEIDPGSDIPLEHAASIKLDVQAANSLAKEMDRTGVLGNLIRPAGAPAPFKSPGDETKEALKDLDVKIRPEVFSGKIEGTSSYEKRELLTRVIDALERIGVKISNDI